MLRYASDMVMFHLCSAIIKVFEELSNTDAATKASFMPTSGRVPHLTVIHRLTVALHAVLSNPALDGHTMRWANTVSLHNATLPKRPRSPSGDHCNGISSPKKPHANSLVPMESQLCPDYIAAGLSLFNGLFPRRSECPRGTSCRRIHVNGLDRYTKPQILKAIDSSANKSFAKQIALRKLVVDQMK